MPLLLSLLRGLQKLLVPEPCGLFRPLKLLECSLLYYFLIVLFLNCAAKVILYFYPCKYFSNYFQYIFIFLSFLALYLIIYNKTGVGPAAVCFMVGIFTAGRGCRIWRPFVLVSSPAAGYVLRGANRGQRYPPRRRAVASNRYGGRRRRVAVAVVCPGAYTPHVTPTGARSWPSVRRGSSSATANADFTCPTDC